MPEYVKSHIVHEFCCPACNSKYIGKTSKFRHPCSRAQWFRQKVYHHFLECEHFNYVVNLHSLPSSNDSVEYLEHVKIDVYDNTKIIDNSQNWFESCFLESLYIKWKKPKLNCSIKATKELVLFS